MGRGVLWRIKETLALQWILPLVRAKWQRCCDVL